MLKHWLKNTSDPNWSDLVEALSSEPVGEKRLAREIHAKYCTAGDSMGSDQAGIAMFFHVIYRYILCLVVTQVFMLSVQYIMSFVHCRCLSSYQW